MSSPADMIRRYLNLASGRVPYPEGMSVADARDALAELEAQAARADAYEKALQVYADPRNWGIQRDEFRYPILTWIGPGATETVPNGMLTARAVLAGEPKEKT